MKRKTLVGLLVIAVVIAAVLVGSYATFVPSANAATDDEIEAAIEAGVTWLAGQQNPDGSWGGWDQAARTCFVLVKLEERADDLGKSPFDSDYPYSDNVIRGWQYIFGVPHAHKQTPLPMQSHNGSPDDPDTNGNGYGVYFDTWGSQPTYTTGICVMALAASGTPNRPNDGGLDFNGDGNPDTFGEIAQEAVDWLAFAQADSGGPEGGWNYGPQDNAGWRADNSVSGYAVLGLAYGQDFGCTVPDWVKTELNVWINYIQCSDGSNNDGGSGYDCPCCWVNELKTGNLIFAMCLYGDGPSVQRFEDALDYIEHFWRHPNIDPGWGFNVYPAGYQAMYCLMKGLEYCSIDLIDTDGDGEHDDDWFNQEPPASPAQDFASVLVAQQNDDGSWPGCNWGDDILCTTWALLVLEKVAPPPPWVPVDIKPQSCPNPLNVKEKGVLPVAILGTDEVDVTQVDPVSVHLEGVAPLRWDLEDVSTPFEPFIGKADCLDCTDEGPDGLLDLTLKFDTQAVVAAIGPVTDGECRVLRLTGEEFGGRNIIGEDVVVIVKKGKQ
jgi:hypothetical protein